LDNRNIPFNDLSHLHGRLRDDILSAIERVVDSGYFILGPQVEAFENEFAAYHGLEYAVGVASGTDALELALRAADIGPGDEVITVAHTAVATVCAIERAGATPVLVDIDPATFTMQPEAAEAAITPRTRAIIPVHIYGQPADLAALAAIAERHKLVLIEDCAQAHGARYKNQIVGTFSQMACFSFYPTKNLGAYGDGGAVITNNAHFAARLKSLRNYGQKSRYYHAERGINSRLDEMQAALLRVKLKHLDSFNEERRSIAVRYDASLNANVRPFVSADAFHVYHLYVIKHPRRDELSAHLASRGIGTLIHYPCPVHLQEGYQSLGYRRGDLPVTEQSADQILSLPLYIGLTDSDIDYVAGVVTHFDELIAHE